MANSSIIVEEARKYLGVRWKHQGRSLNGVDCLGLVARVYGDLGLIDVSKDRHNYARLPNRQQLAAEFEAAGFIAKSVINSEAGNVVLFKQGVYPCHCAIITFKNRVKHIIHAYAPRKKVIEEPYSYFEQDAMHCFEVK